MAVGSNGVVAVDGAVGSVVVIAAFALGACTGPPEPAPAGQPAGPSCTAFRLLADGRPIIGRNLDWSVEDGFLAVNPRRTRRRSTAENRPLTWVARYASLTFDQLGPGLPLGGMNDAGLVVEELSYSLARYPPQGDRPAVNELEWIQLQLDTRATVRAVLEHLEDVAITPLLFGLHYFLADASGEAAVIEFLEGRTVVHQGDDLPVAVLTNDTYERSVRYLERHAGFGGTRAVGDGPESPERFVRAATLLVRDPSGATSADPVGRAFRILGAVAQRDTRWRIVYDASRRVVHFRTARVPATRWLELTGLGSTCAGPPLALDMGRSLEGDVRADLEPWSRAPQEELIGRVLDRLTAEEDVDAATRDRVLEAVRGAATSARCETAAASLESNRLPGRPPGA